MPPAVPADAPPPAKARLPAAVVLLGFTSLLTDASSEMIFPLLPVFLATMGAAPWILGLIEGVADAISSFLRLWSGSLADRLARRKPLVVAGYSIATFVRPLVGFATSPWHVLLVRAADRVGKGIRSSPRDALIADAAPPGQAGRAFGFHRAMDHAGAVVGPLLATGLLAIGLEVRDVFFAAIVPGALALVMVLLVKEPPRASPPTPTPTPTLPPASSSTPLPRRLRAYCVVLAVFALGNATDAFLLLRARELGVPDALIPTLWMVLHVVKVASSTVFGGVSDRVPRTTLIVVGWLVYAATYVGLAFATTALHAWVLFVVYGLYHGLCEPAEKALVKDLAPVDARGRAYGAYNFTVGIMAVPAGLLCGVLWTQVSSLAALSTGAALALVAAALLVVWSRR